MKPSQTTIEKLQGTWDIVALEVEGKPMPSTGAQIVVKEDRFTTTGMGETYQGKLVVDDSKTPFALDLKFTAGPEKGNTNRGIFEFVGDEWRLCLQMTGGERPKRFATTPGRGLALETLRRAAKRTKAKAKSTSAKPRGEAAPELEGDWAMVSCVSGGIPLAAEFVKHGRRVATGGQITVTMMGRVMLKANYAVNKATKPKSIDYELKGGTEQLGIYDLEGGLLKVNFSPPGQARPKAFASVAGDGCTFTTWRRIKRSG